MVKSTAVTNNSSGNFAIAQVDDPCTWEGEAEEWGVSGHPQLHTQCEVSRDFLKPCLKTNKCVHKNNLGKKSVELQPSGRKEPGQRRTPEKPDTVGARRVAVAHIQKSWV